MIKRISLLVTAALLVATMAMAGLAGPAFAFGHPNCTKENPPEVECEKPAKNNNNPFKQETEQKGSTHSSHEPEVTGCTKKGEEVDKCPPGQFPSS